MAIPLKAVIFDYGNVLTGPQNAAEIAEMSAIFGVAPDEFVDAYWRDRLLYDQAALDPESYWHALAGRLSRELDSAQIPHLIDLDNDSWLQPNQTTVEWARKVKRQGLATGLISNMPVPLRKRLEAGVDWLPPFDQMTFSCDLRTSKPDARIYQHSLDGLGIEPESALFLDDREENAAGAEAVGMHAILFQDASKAIAEIERRFRLSSGGSN